MALGIDIGAQIRAAFKPAQDTLFELLRGIRREQVRTNELLSELINGKPSSSQVLANQLLIKMEEDQ